MDLLESPLQDKIILAVDDEPDILDTIEDELVMCIVHKAVDYDTAIQYILGYTYDIVILDIMGVNGFELLKTSVTRGFPTVMLTAHSLTPEALKSSIKLGAVSFIPKEKLYELTYFLEDIIKNNGHPVWLTFFNKLGAFFDRRFGADWKKRDLFFEEFQKKIMESEGIT